jgi:hypothetical protein
MLRVVENYGGSGERMLSEARAELTSACTCPLNSFSDLYTDAQPSCFAQVAAGDHQRGEDGRNSLGMGVV